MKHFIILMLSTLTCSLCVAQCPKNLLLKFSQVTEIRDEARTPFKTEGIIRFSQDSILISSKVNGEDRVIESTIDSVSACAWNREIQNGMSSYSLSSSKILGEPKDKATLILTCENGKLMVTFKPPGAELQFLITECKIIE